MTRHCCSSSATNSPPSLLEAVGNFPDEQTVDFVSTLLVLLFDFIKVSTSPQEVSHNYNWSDPNQTNLSEGAAI